MAGKDRPDEARPFTSKKAGGEKKGRGPSAGVAGQLLKIHFENHKADPFKGEDGQPYVRLTVDGRRRTVHANGSDIARLTQIAFLKSGSQTAPNPDALNTVLSTLSALAYSSTVVRPVHKRVFGSPEMVVIDSGRPDGSLNVATRAGAKVVPSSDVDIDFIRPPGISPLPVPDFGGSLDTFFNYTSLASDDDRQLWASSLVNSAFHSGPFPLVELIGPQGSGKSSAAEFSKRIYDPSPSNLRTPPLKPRDLGIGLENHWMVVFDNAAPHTADMSDTLCRASTMPGGHSERSLYSNSEEVSLGRRQPITFTSIVQLGRRPDYVDRALPIHFKALTGARQTDREREASFRKDHPGILGGFLNVLCSTLRDLPAVPGDLPFRMADFAENGVAAEVALGFEPGSFVTAYQANRASSDGLALETDPIATAIRDWVLVDGFKGWVGTATQLLEILSTKVSEATRRSRLWPNHVASLGQRLARFIPLLGALGVEIRAFKQGHGRTRLLEIRRRSDV